MGLDIPEFMKRDPSPKRRRRTSKPQPWRMPDRGSPTGKRFVKAKRYTVWFNDEARGIPSGRRTVWAVRGRKWAYVKSCPESEATKIKVSVFDRHCMGEVA